MVPPPLKGRRVAAVAPDSPSRVADEGPGRHRAEGPALSDAQAERASAAKLLAENSGWAAEQLLAHPELVALAYAQARGEHDQIYAGLKWWQRSARADAEQHAHALTAAASLLHTSTRAEGDT